MVASLYSASIRCSPKVCFCEDELISILKASPIYVAIIILMQFHFMFTVKQETLIDSRDNLSAVTCLDTFDLYGDGKEELIVGRRDGTIQVFTTMMLENNEFEMDCQQLLYEENFNESISCVFGGCIGMAGYTEIIACTYTGKVFGLTTRTLGDILTDAKSNNYDVMTDATQRIHKLK